MSQNGPQLRFVGVGGQIRPQLRDEPLMDGSIHGMLNGENYNYRGLRQGLIARAIWDARRRLLVLARNHLGQKPLFWASS